jgi:hypothetical protein
VTRRLDPVDRAHEPCDGLQAAELLPLRLRVVAPLLTFLATSVATIGFDCHGLNAKSYWPEIRHDNFNWTVLASASGNRILLDGKLNQTDVRNFLLFQEVAFA